MIAVIMIIMLCGPLGGNVTKVCLYLTLLEIQTLERSGLHSKAELLAVLECFPLNFHLFFDRHKHRCQGEFTLFEAGNEKRGKTPDAEGKNGSSLATWSHLCSDHPVPIFQ